ncbi:MAG: YebC/PmpR family DNA-binding transcriptional regulator [Firmicutes bacterium]|nr:YebC/PmpR family DNA-binding transcriptional regulator [Bacillota bacterium]
MAGHSKWSQIKRAKGKTDAQRAKAFTKLGREIAVAVKLGGSDPSSNSRLRDCIAKAKSANMPTDNITRSIKKASGELGAINYDTIIYEGYGVDGVAVIVETLTDNKNRTAGDVRHIFDKYGAGLGVSGCVGFLFEAKGVLRGEIGSKFNEDTVIIDAIEAGADDVAIGEDSFDIFTSSQDFSSVREALENRGYQFFSSGVERVPSTTVEVTDTDKFTKMLDFFEDNDDVQNVYHNAK